MSKIKKYTIDEEIQHLEGLLVMMNDDREMFGFVEEDEKKYREIVVKIENLKQLI